jgi:hypothetical protein
MLLNIANHAATGRLTLFAGDIGAAKTILLFALEG